MTTNQDKDKTIKSISTRKKIQDAIFEKNSLKLETKTTKGKATTRQAKLREHREWLRDLKDVMKRQSTSWNKNKTRPRSSMA